MAIVIATCNISAAANGGPHFSATVAPEVPREMTFCGEKINFERVDMYERMDRELTSVIYGQTTTSLIIKRARRYFHVLEKILHEQGVPRDFIYLAVTESALEYDAYSSAKAAGMWQLLAATGQQYGLEVSDEVDERYDPEKSAVAACKYLKAAYAKYGNWATVAASYNAGMSRITGELSKQYATTSFDLFLNKETSRYVFRILAYKLVLESPARYGYHVSKDQLYRPMEYTEEVVITSVPDWPAWAKQRGLTYAQLRAANPWIRSTKLTNSRGRYYTVRIPKPESLKH